MYYTNKIDYFDISLEPDLTPIKIINGWSIYEKAFRINKTKPKNKYQLIITIVSMIRHITNREMIKQKVQKINKKEYNIYEFNWNYIQEHTELNKFQKNENINQVIINKLNITNLTNDFN